MIIPRGGENPAAISVIARQIYKYLEENCGLVEGGLRLSAARALETGAEDSAACAARTPPTAASQAQQQQPLLGRSLSTGVPVSAKPTSPGAGASLMRGLTLATYSADEDGAGGAFMTGVPALLTPNGSTIFVDPVGARSPPRSAERSASGSGAALPLASPTGAGASARQRNVSESGYSVNLTRPH